MGQFFDHLASLPHQPVSTRAEKLAGTGVIAATFTPGSKALSALRPDSTAAYLPIDLDDLPGTDTADGRKAVGRLLRSMSQWDSVVWTTASHTSTATRIRWLVALAEPIPNHDVRQWRRLYRAAMSALGVEAQYDKEASDAVRWSLLPQVKPGQAEHAFNRRFNGRQLDLAALQPYLDTQDALGNAQQATTDAKRVHAEATQRAQTALDLATRNLRKAPQGARHHTLNKQVYLLAVRHAHAITEDEIQASFMASLRQTEKGSDVELDYDAAARTIHDAFTSGAEVNHQERSTWRGALSRATNGEPHSTPANVLTVLTHHDDFNEALAFDERLQRAVWHRESPWKSPAGATLSDMDALQATVWFRDHVSISAVQPNSAFEAMTAVAHANSFDAFMSYLATLEWDRIPRLDGWLQRHAGAERGELPRIYFSKWLISAVARTFEPGCRVDHTLILEGRQGLRKSTFFAELAKPGGQQAFQDALPPIEGKDAKIACHGPVIVEFGELRNITNREIEAVKAFLTTAYDTFRAPYARVQDTLPRRCVFAGSTNDSAYLTDATGNRRFWPLRVDAQIDIDTLTEERDQLWAEALHRYQAKEEWWLSEAQEQKAAASQDDRRLEDPRDEPVIEGLSNTVRIAALAAYPGFWEHGQLNDADARKPLRWITTKQACALADIQNPHAGDYRRVSAILEGMRWRRHRCTHDAAQRWRYFPPNAHETADEVLALARAQPHSKKKLHKVS